jgi:cytochrome P450
LRHNHRHWRFFQFGEVAKLGSILSHAAHSSESKVSDTAYHKIRTRRVSAPSDCPIDHSFSPFSDSYLQNPYGELAKRRGSKPVFYAEELGCLVLTRMEDVSEVFRNPDVYSSENVQDPVRPICAAAVEILSAADYNPIAVMSNRARPDHTRIRKYTMAGFSSRRMNILEPFIRQRCQTLVGGMLAQSRPADFVKSVAHPLPGETIFRFIGFPETDDEMLKDWTTNRLAFTWGQPTDEEQVEIARKMLAYWRYCVSFVEMRRGTRTDDFTSELLAAHDADPDDLRYREIESIVYGLSFAGHEIVSNLLSNSLINLLSARSQWDELCADPGLIPNAVEEILRHNSSQTSWRRVALRETEIAGYKIPAGTQIFLSLASANHDEAVFENPEAFDIHRENARANIAFGRGIHFCLGNRLAILEAEIVLETLTRRVPSLDLTPDQTFTYFPNFTFRGPEALWLTWAT